MPFKKYSANNSLSLLLKKLSSVSKLCCCAALPFSFFFKWSQDTMWILSHSVFHSSKPHCLQLQKKSKEEEMTKKEQNHKNHKETKILVENIYDYGYHGEKSQRKLLSGPDGSWSSTINKEAEGRKQMGETHWQVLAHTASPPQYLKQKPPFPSSLHYPLQVLCLSPPFLFSLQQKEWGKGGRRQIL